VRILIATVATVVVSLLVPNLASPAASQSWQWQYTKWMPKHWINLAACESGSSPPNWAHNSGTYEGAFGFWYGTWDSYKLSGYPSSASQATPWQQWQVAKRIAHKLTIRIPWGCWRGSQHAWVRNGLPEYGTRS
jgi:hypothetical protein